MRGGNSIGEEESIGGLSALRNVGKSTKEGVLGTPSAPIHMVSTEGGHFKEQLWRTFRALGMSFLLISGVGALIEDRGISKGIIGNLYYIAYVSTMSNSRGTYTSNIKDLTYSVWLPCIG